MTTGSAEPQARETTGDTLAEQLRGFGPLGIAAILVIVLASTLPVLPVSALLVLLWAQRSRTPWREIGFVRPTSWLATIVLGIVFGAAFKIAMKAIVMPLLGADPVNHAYHYLEWNQAELPGTIFAMIVRAGFGEETLFRGYLFERLGKLLGAKVWAKAVIVATTSALFGLAHYPEQGITGVEQATIAGLVYGTILAITGRIFVLMIAHAAFDLTALWLIYWGLETRVAHLVFR